MKKLKKHAFAARRALLDGVRRQAALHGLTDVEKPPPELEGFFESFAGCWFNRIIALRFMEFHGFLDHGRRENDAFRRESLLADSNELHESMPFLFEESGAVDELLLPDDLSAIQKLLEAIPAERWQQAETIGWLYQFYHAEKKKTILGKIVASEDIPTATRLFTPNWIVRYLVQNTLGRRWLTVYPDSVLRFGMEFFVDSVEQPPGVRERLEAATPKSLDPEKLTFLDPACGCGHILVEAYELFKAIYRERGYRAEEIPSLILSKNLFGIEIDDQAAQLAALTLMMKARTDDPGFFSRKMIPKILSIRETNGLDAAMIAEQLDWPETEIGELCKLFEHGKTLGTLIRIPEHLAERLPALETRLTEIFVHAEPDRQESARQFEPILRQARLLARRFDFVLANPPYMGGRYMNRLLKEHAKTAFPDTKNDVFAMFIERNCELTEPDGLLGFMSPFVWMFISSYRELRKFILERKTIQSLIQLEYSGFDGATVPICAFTLLNRSFPEFKGGFVRLSDFRGSENQALKTLEALANPGCGWFFTASAEDFRKVPGCAFAYWLSDHALDVFSRGTLLGKIAPPKQGLATTDNEKHLRRWFEIPFENIAFGLADRRQAADGGMRWFLYNKGGNYRRWYGNNEFVVDWQDDGRKIKEDVCRKYPYLDGKPDYVTKNQDFYFKEGITWTYISSEYFGVRYSPPGFVFDVAGSSVFPTNEELRPLLGFLSSVVADFYLGAINSTLNIQAGNVGKLPVLREKLGEHAEWLETNVGRLVELAKADWDSFETSWDFKGSPLLEHRSPDNRFETAYDNYRNTAAERVRETRRLETSLNALMLDVYGLSDELNPELPESAITLSTNPAYRYGNDRSDTELEALFRSDTVKEFLSYAVGCATGRYSPDSPGLVDIKGETVSDGILPFGEDDSIPWFRQFLLSVFGEERLTENLEYIEKVLGKPVGEYFFKDFFAEHLKRYKKRPIYWLFSSGRQGAFRCLVYIHRYEPETLDRMRTRYVLPLFKSFEKQIDRQQEKRLEELRLFDQKLREIANERIELDLDDGVKINYGKFGSLLAEVKTVVG